MARQLRLHFASRRSNTDPLSDTCSGHAEESGLTNAGRSSSEGLVQSSLRMKVTPGQLALALPPLSPEYSNLQRNSTVFIPKVNGSRKSMLQISLQPCGGDGELASCESGNGDGGSCSSSTTSDAGYCSSNSIFEADVQDRKPFSRRKARVPLRRCSSLVIFPQSPCTTPPASPVSPVASPMIPPLPPSARSSFQTSHQMQLSSIDALQDDTAKGSVATAVNGLRLSKTSTSSENRDAKPIVHFSVPPEQAPGPERTERHSSVLLHFANQRPLPSGKGSSAKTKFNIDTSKPLEGPQTNNVTEPQKAKLFRSTSSCMLPSGRASSTERRHDTFPTCGNSDKSSRKGLHRTLQRSISLEVPYANAEISCHVSNAADVDTKNGTPHVHIRVSHGTGARTSNTLQNNSINNETHRAATCTERNATVRFTIY
ncbi:E3 ubiquitin-protein ligase NEDD4-like [Carassius gibelio]|uniref:E3 ubiquitin-protein ligase NEDD4-like n=1 Tax=Carassius gibelio TaxID=101364 RepID=UPI0022789486|nr:E3 ubiquitin-protein ligase NEDD4-like [Carassius gibelio]